MPKADPKTAERRERFRDYCKSRGWHAPDSDRWNVTAISAHTGKPTQKVSDLLNGHGSFGAKIAREIEVPLGLPEGFLDGLSSDDDFSLVPRVDVKVSAGHGELVIDEGQRSALSFRRSFLRDIGVSPSSAVVVSVKGHSMEPTIRDGAVLLVSTASRTIVDREIYAFRLDGSLYVKRMRKGGFGLVAESDNQDRETYPNINIASNDPDVEIIGRALWMGTKL
jgi:hypothetical protein